MKKFLKECFEGLGQLIVVGVILYVYGSVESAIHNDTISKLEAVRSDIASLRSELEYRTPQ